MKYRDKTSDCSGCSYNSTLEHKLYHESGLNEHTIKKCGFKSIDEIKIAFSQAKYISPCFIMLNGEKVKIKEKDTFLAYEELVKSIKEKI